LGAHNDVIIGDRRGGAVGVRARRPERDCGHRLPHPVEGEKAAESARCCRPGEADDKVFGVDGVIASDARGHEVVAVSRTVLHAVGRALLEGVVDWPFPRPAAKALVERDGRHLLVRQDVGDGYEWVLPGGGVESGESAREAVVREVREEVGLDVEVAGPVDTYDFQVGQGQVLVTVFRCVADDGEVTLDENPDYEPIDDAGWVKPDDLDSLAVPDDLRPVLERHLGADDGEVASETATRG
jgi:8-oxo-dGTP pyrophosphatase MutT (NUDIX family)